MKPLAPNSLIQNRYLVVQLIGKGGMGDVYLAVDQRLGSAIALKRTFFTDDEVLKNAFEREAKTLARLRHPALPKVSDHFNEADTQFLVMEHISGDDLGARLEQQKKPFPLSWVLFWADQLLDALAYLHSHEPPIIHRDIKPQNLKLTNENHIILLDFGLAKNTVGETRLSTTGGVVAYTPHYASMEQIGGTGTTARSDIYSLSATMYHLLAASVPPDALSRADALLNGMPDLVQPLSELNPEVSPAISNVILKGLSMSAEQRFANARDMQAALREAYLQVQTGTSADTVTFNTDASEPSPAAIPSDLKTIPFVTNQPIGEKTEVMPVDIGMKTEVMPVDIGMKTEVMPVNLVSESQPMPSVELPIPSSNKPDATLPFVTPLVFDQTNQNPIDFEKTEVMPFDIPTPPVETNQVMPTEVSSPIGEKTEVIPFDIALSDKTEAFVSAVPVQTQENFVNQPFESLSPEATVPLVVYDGLVSEVPNQATANFVSSQPSGANTEYFTPTAEPIAEVSAPVVAEPQKKAGGGGKMILIIGIIFGLGFLAIAGTGVGLYLFKPEVFGIASTTPTPTPTPSPEVTPSPSVTPSPEKTVEAANSNIGNTNANVGNVNAGDSNTNTTKTPDIIKDKTPITGGDKTPQPGPTRQPTTQPTRSPQPTKPQPTKTVATPKPTICRTCPLQ